jgi:hypothetical protein
MQGERGEQGMQGIQGIQGVPGPMGPKGEQGPAGQATTLKGSFDTLQDLQNAHPTGNPGDAYLVGNLPHMTNYWNLIALQAKDAESADIKAIVDAYHSDVTREALPEKYGGQSVPVF